MALFLICENVCEMKAIYNTDQTQITPTQWHLRAIYTLNSHKQQKENKLQCRFLKDMKACF